MSTTSQSLFAHHMNAMREHYKSGASHSYALPLSLRHPADDALSLASVAADPPPIPKELLEKAEDKLTSVFTDIRSAASASVQAFEEGGGIDALVAQLSEQKEKSKTAVGGAIDEFNDVFTNYGLRYPQAQPQILDLTTKYGDFITSLLVKTATFFTELGNDIVRWSQKVVYVSAWASISNWFTGAIRSIGNFFTDLGAEVEKAFDALAQAAKDAWDDMKNLVKQALDAAENAILEPIAREVLDGLPINDLRDAWAKVSGQNPDAVSIIRSSVMGKQVTPEAKAAMRTLGEQMQPHVEQFHKGGGASLADVEQLSAASSFLSFGFESQMTGGYVLGGDGALGMLIGVPAGDVVGYGSLGASLGATEGAEVDDALVLEKEAPEDAGGVYVGIILSLDVDVGGTVQVKFTFPGFDLRGISIGLGGGEEASLAIGGGYTWTF